MEKINKLLYGILFSILFITSANAQDTSNEWQMFKGANNDTFIYNTKTGEVFMRMMDKEEQPVMSMVFYANGIYRFARPTELIKNTFPISK